MRTRYPSETIPRSRRLRRDATEPEIRLWRKLRALKPLGYHFRRQAPFQFYFLDFVEHGRRLVIEVDGETHGSDLAKQHDSRRDQILSGQGYTVLRFSNDEVMKNIDGVVTAILLASPPTRIASQSDLPTRGR